MFLQPPKQPQDLFSHMARRSPTTVSSISSWHPIHSSPSEDMWELPASSSSFSDDRDDFHTSGLHQEFSIYHDDYSTNTALSEHQDSRVSLPPTVTFRTNNDSSHRRDSSSVRSGPSGRNRNGISKQRCVLGDATNTLRRQNNSSNNNSTADTRRIQRSYFN